MTSRAWMITAWGLAAAVTTAAADDLPFRSNPTGAGDAATRRAGDYFSRVGRSSVGSGGLGVSRPVSSTLTDPPSLDGASGAAADDSDAQPDPRPLPRQTFKLAPKSAPAEDADGAGASDDAPAADPTFQRLRRKSRPAVQDSEVAPTSAKDAASDANAPAPPKARTPSGAPLSRGMSRNEESSGIIHAMHVSTPSESGRIEKVRAERDASDDSENPFVPAEELLKNDVKRQKRIAADRSGAPNADADFPPRPETKPAKIEPRSDARRAEAAKSQDKKPAEGKSAGTKPQDSKTAGAKGADAKSADAKSGDAKGVKPAGNVSELRSLPGRSASAKKDSLGPVTRVSHTVPDAEPAEVYLAGEAPAGEALNDGSQSPQVTVRWVKRSEINVGQPCECDLVVKNNGPVAAHEIIVEAHFPKTVRLTNTKPEPSQTSEHLTWTFPTLAPGEEQSIRIGMIPSHKGELATTANVRFTGSAAGLFQVDEPMLAVMLKGVKEVLVGDSASQIITVSNPGTGVAQNVTVEAIIPKGLEHPRGERLQMEVGSLGSGESRTIRLALATSAGGQYQVQVTAKADANLSQVATADVVVIAPSVKLSIEGPALRYIGRNAIYVLNTLNDGAAPSNNVRVIHKIPDGFKFVRADKGGKYDESNQTVSWFVGRLEPGQSIPVKLEMAPTKLGAFMHRAGAVSEQGAKSEAQFETVVDGTAALQLELVESADPVEVGTDATYEIRLKNNGSKAAQTVGISCELPSAVQLVGAKGPTEFLSENGLVVFKSLPSLAAGKTATYRVTVKATVEGNHRFRVRLASESITEPLISEEMTKFYGE